MTSPSTQFVTSSRLGTYEPLHLISMWSDFKGNCFQNTEMENQLEDSSHETSGPSSKSDQEAIKPIDKALRRLAQNREAARKCRLRKKAYVQELENSKMRLIQVEQELERARQQGVYLGGGLIGSPFGYSGPINPGIIAFETKYAHWIEEQNKQISVLKTALNSDAVTDIELKILVDAGMRHYFELFRMKEAAAKVDVFYIMSGMWRTSAERFFLWIGGFRPSELIQVLLPRLNPLSDSELLDVYNLRQSCQQAEEALSQGMDKLRQTLSETLVACQVCEGNYIPQKATLMEKLEALVSFANQADFIRNVTLQQMCSIIPLRQSAQGLLALGEYFQCLRATRPREPT